MSAANGIQEAVRSVNSTEGLDLVLPRPASLGTIHELLEFAHELRGQGLDLGPRIEKVEQVWAAAQGALTFDVSAVVHAIDIDTVDPSEIEGIVNRAATSYMANLRTSFFDAVQESGVYEVLNTFDRALTRQAGTLLRNDADNLVSKLRKDFDAALKVVKVANKEGIINKTRRDELLDTGTPAAIDAYRALPAAVSKLDAIARLRLEMGRRLGYRPAAEDREVGLYDVAAFITPVANDLQYQAAELAWEGENEPVQVNGDFVGASIHRVRKPRHGGAWLDLIQGGHDVHLNTAAEAGAVIASSNKAA